MEGDCLSRGGGGGGGGEIGCVGCTLHLHITLHVHLFVITGERDEK